MKITQALSPNRSGTLHPRAIMLHHTANTDFSAAVAYMRKRTSAVSAHYVVGKGGEVAQLVPLSQQAWHAGLGSGIGTIPRNKGNTYAIGIEIVNRGDNKDPFPKAQLEALDDLIAHLDKTLGKALPIYDHKGYAPGRKIDMRANFPLANYKAYRTHTKPAEPKITTPPKPTTYKLKRVLKLTRIRYMRGDDVKRLQTALKSYGAGTADGVFGPKTKAAVIKFQRDKKLVVDGIVGPATARALGWKWVKPTAATKPKPTTYTLKRVLKLTRIRYMRGDDVRELQRALGGLKVDGVFGPNTRSAVVRFQRAKKLVVDGIVGPATARALGWKWV